MTRENKLALVLGFGLMLFVGILVSDHLAARKAPPVAANTILANNHEVVPPMPARGDEGMVLFGEGGRVLVRPDEPRSAPAHDEVAPTQPQHAPSQMAGQGDESRPDDQSRELAIAPPAIAPPAITQPVRNYVVQEGDSFAAIARREYGRTSLGERLAAYNGVQPRALRAGASIKLPPAEDLDPRMASAQAQPDAPGVPAVPSVREYTVRRGDSLFAIAERELGRGSRWEELKRFNEDVLKGRDALTPGMQIRIPVDA